MHQIIIRIIFDAHSSVYRIAHGMCEHGSVRIISDFITVLINPRLGKHFPVGGIDSTAADILKLYLLSVVIAVVVKLYRGR